MSLFALFLACTPAEPTPAQWCLPYQDDFEALIDESGLFAELSLGLRYHTPLSVLDSHRLQANVAVEAFAFTDDTPGGFDLSTADGSHSTSCDEDPAGAEIAVSLNIKGDGEEGYTSNVGLDLLVPVDEAAQTLEAEAVVDIGIYGEEVVEEERELVVLFERW